MFEKTKKGWKNFVASKFMLGVRKGWNSLGGIFRHLTLPYKEMIFGKGITRRWLLTTFSIVGIMLMITLIVSVSFINIYYYNTIQQDLTQRASVTADYFSETAGNALTSSNDSDYFSAAQSFIEGFEDKELMELQFINSKGKVIVSSSGFEPLSKPMMPDYDTAVKSGDIGIWNGHNENKEHVLAVSYILTSPSGNSNRAVRLIVSMQPTDGTVTQLIAVIFLIILAVLMFISISSTYFIRSIVDPVRNITNIAGAIANGDFSIRLQKQHDDEIGDLTDSINAMAAELALSEKAKNDFISSVSHELRTPLTAIKGWSETMLTPTLEDPMTRRGLEIIIKESQRLNGLVEQLLDFSRLQSGRMVMNFQVLDVIAEIDDVVFMFADKAKKEEKRLTFYEPEQPVPVMADRDKFKQVMIIIIDNAMKYSESGGEIYVYTSMNDGKIIIGVRDHGCGIPADQLPKVKERFYKVNTEKGGFGIGLAVADEIIRKHGGEFNIDSVEGDGTNVTVTLPIADTVNSSDAKNINESKKEDTENGQN